MKPEREPTITPAELVGEGLSFPVGPRRAEVSLRIAGGETMQVAGPSGSGKTTLLKILARLRAPLSGELSLNGRGADEVEPRAWRRRVAYLAQRSVVFPGTVEDNLRLAHGLKIAKDETYDPARAAELLDGFGLPPDRFLDQDALTLSVGEQQRVEIIKLLFPMARVRMEVDNNHLRPQLLQSIAQSEGSKLHVFVIAEIRVWY